MLRLLSSHFSLILLFPLFNRCWRTFANICVSLVGFGSTIVGLSRSKASVYSTFSSWYTISSCVYELRTTVTVVQCFWGLLRAGFVLCGPLPHLYCVTRRFLVISMPCVDCLVILIFCLCMCVNLNTNNGLIPFLPPLFFYSEHFFYVLKETCASCLGRDDLRFNCGNVVLSLTVTVLEVSSQFLALYICVLQRFDRINRNSICS